MKYIILLCDGMADHPLEELDGGTPMSRSVTPNTDMLAKKSRIGLVRTVAEGLKPGSDVANLSVLGYDPAVCYTGRSPLEAGSIGIDMGADDVSFRCNLVTVSDEADFEDKTLIDYCAGDISTAEGKALTEYLAEHFNSKEFALYSGVSYRHCLIWHGGTLDLAPLTPPHDITGRKVREYIPSHPNAAKLYDMMKKSVELLRDHPVNRERISKGLNPANCVWFWGEGKRAELENFTEKTGLKAAMISAVDLLKGIAKFGGMEIAEVEGATGYIDTNFKGKAQAALDALERGCDLVYVHMEAPDECGHRGEVANKVRSLEIIDRDVLGYMLPELEKKYEDYKIMILPDHPTPLALRTHVSDPVPFLVYKKSEPVKSADSFNEETAKAAGLFIEKGPSLMDYFIDL
ncbi:MAG: cofactor-independent phosphoglycerate mutase [Ruminococcus sp.]|nr:cofactor-independent phosphoglycerate mutase [Ruminococcus sp.]